MPLRIYRVCVLEVTRRTSPEAEQVQQHVSVIDTHRQGKEESQRASHPRDFSLRNICASSAPIPQRRSRRWSNRPEGRVTLRIPDNRAAPWIGENCREYISTEIIIIIVVIDSLATVATAHSLQVRTSLGSTDDLGGRARRLRRGSALRQGRG